MFKKTNELNRKKIIFVDVDDTIADTRTAIVSLYEEITKDKAKSFDEVKTKTYCDFCPKWTDDEISKIFKSGKEVYSRALPLVGAIEGINYLLSKDYEVYITTMNCPESVKYKQEWIARHFPELETKVIYIDWRIPNKDFFEGYALIDDDIKNVTGNRSCYPILLDFYNVYDKSEVPKNTIICRTWKEIMNKL